MLKFILPILLLFQLAGAQEYDLKSSSIPENLKENADAVVRLNSTDITISGRKSMTTKQTRIVTVLNENGIEAIDAYEYYDKSTSVRSIEALIYDANGTQLKKVKKKDFKDISASGDSMLTDNRLLTLDYTPIQYPFTVVFTSETETSNTAFLPQWYAAYGNNVSIEKSTITINCIPELGFKYKEYNFEAIAVKKEQSGNALTYTADNIPAAKKEEYSPSIAKITPSVLFAVNKFHLEGIDGEATDWKTFGKWRYESLLLGADELPVATIEKIKSLVGSETDPLKKAKIVYEYVQSKTRYVSIQLGIGGWKPMPAKDVDRLGYGDCKALTNYTKALLKAVGVDSYYTVIYGDTDRRDIIEDFVCMQGNHIILAIPDGGKYVWLECTSQTAPFGFQGDFTDDRLALVVKPEGGEIIRTTIYDTQGNLQASKGAYRISDTGAIFANLVIASKGTQYDNKYFLESRSKEDKDKFYKSQFRNVNNLKLKKTDLKNNKDLKEFTEDIAFDAESYCNKSGDRLIFSVNAFNQHSSIPQRYRNRKNPFEIQRGFLDTDEITIDLPEGYAVESKPTDVTVKDKFGEYSAKYTVSATGAIVYKRSLMVNPGYYANSEYENFRLFSENIAKNDNAKIVLLKK